MVVSATAQFLNNRVTGNKAGLDGAGIVAGGTSVTLANCIVSGNSAGRVGGGIMVSGSIHVGNCVVISNHAPIGGGIRIGISPKHVVISNTILYDNAAQQVSDAHLSSQVSYCVIGGGLPWATNSITTDPLFVDTANGDYRLQPGSPAIDRGHNWLVATDDLDLDNDGNTDELTPLDLDGNARIANGGARSGCGAPAIVDIGAYEFQGVPITIDLCIGDTDGNGAIDVFDLLELLSAWGLCVDDCCLADLVVDGVIDVFDLLDLLAAWGACE